MFYPFLIIIPILPGNRTNYHLRGLKQGNSLSYECQERNLLWVTTQKLFSKIGSYQNRNHLN